MFVNMRLHLAPTSASLDGLTHCKEPNKWEDREADSQMDANRPPDYCPLASVPVSSVTGL